MQCRKAENQPASTSTGEPYFFSFWPYEDRAFLRALYKKFACAKVHLMAEIMKSAPADSWDCGHWRMWENMARHVCSELGHRVSPKKMESFFWDVIAQGTDVDDVNERLDKLIYGASGACSAGDTSSSAPGKVTATEAETTASEDKAANHTDQGVQCAPTCADKALQCDIGPPSIADMMYREHLLCMEELQLRKEVLMKELGQSPP